MKQVLWISRHRMTDPQRSDLERILGGPFLLDQWDATVKDIEELRPAVERADLVAAVLPLELLSKLLPMSGSRPVIQSVSQRVPTGGVRYLENGDTEREYAFVHSCWQRLLRVDIEVARL